MEREGARYTFLARLSPVPSWINNYGLAFAGVRFVDYAPATALATLPPVLTHVYAGTLISSLVTLVDGGGVGGNVPSTLVGSSLTGLSVVTGCLLLRDLVTAMITDEKTIVETLPEVIDLPERNDRTDEV